MFGLYRIKISVSNDLKIIEILYTNSFGLKYEKLKYFYLSDLIPYQFDKIDYALDFMRKFPRYKNIKQHNTKENERYENYKQGKLVNHTLKN